MIALAPTPSGTAPLGIGERFALDLLLDLSRVLRVEGDGDVVRLRIVDGDARSGDLASLGARGWGITVAAGELLVERALLVVVHRIAGAVDEQLALERDRHGRVPSTANLLAQHALERVPVVSEIARAIADAVVSAGGHRRTLFVAPWPATHRWAAALTHDLDVVEWWPAFTALRLAELARKGELRRLAQVVGAAAASAGRSPVLQGVSEVLATERRFGVRSTWFVLCGTPTLASARAGDLTYRPEHAATRRILDAVREGGHEIGLHGSFATSDHLALFSQQRERLGALAGVAPRGVRQHYLRMRPGATQRGMADAGFTFDSTFGFADRNGFRLGVADVVPMWDEQTGQVLPIDELPFTWMDRALSKYRGVEDPEAWTDDATALAERCRAVQGLFVGIWHPNLTPALGYPAAPAAYARLVSSLVERGAWLAPMSDIVAWRRVRRATRASRVAPDGRVELVPSADSPAGTRVVLEDAGERQTECRVGA